MKSPHTASAAPLQVDRPVSEALERVYDSTQRLVMRRVDLLVAETRCLLQGAVVGLLACLLCVGGLAWLSYAAVAALDGILSAQATAAAIGGAQVLLGLAVGAMALRCFAAASPKP